MTGMSGLSNRLRYIRESRGYNQTQIAHLLQTSQQTYSRYENGEHDLPSRHLFRLAEFYQVSADYLLCRTERPVPVTPPAVPEEENLSREEIALLIERLTTLDRSHLLNYLSFLMSGSANSRHN